MAVLERSGAPPPAETSAPEQDDGYRCDCDGFKRLDVMRFCLRCLTAYAEGLELVHISPLIRQRKMRQVAVRLAQLLKDDPLVASLPLTAVLRAVE